MKKIILTYFLFVCLFVQAQINLVNNPSFEDTISCPDWNPSGIGGDVKNWVSFENTPDYLNACVPNVLTNNNSVPQNGWGYQYASTGSAYCGFWAYQTFQQNTREMIGAQLLSPMVIGKTYYVSMKISLAEISNCATDKVGISFSTVSYTQYSGTDNPVFPNNFSHLYSNTVDTDTLNWITITDTIVADSAYQYIIIGNLFNDSNTDTLILGPPKIFGYGAYYFVDDVYVLSDSTNSIAENNFQDKMGIYPNPANNKIFITLSLLEKRTVKIYSSFGQLLFENNFLEKNITIDLHSYPDGMYLIQVQQNNTFFNSRILLIK